MLVAAPELGLNAPAVQACRDVGEDQRFGAETAHLQAGEILTGVGALNGIGGVMAHKTPDDTLGIVGTGHKLGGVAGLHMLSGRALGDHDALRRGRGRGRIRHGKAHIGGVDRLRGHDDVLRDEGTRRLGNAGDVNAVILRDNLNAVGKIAGAEDAAFDRQRTRIELDPAHFLSDGIGADVFCRGGHTRQCEGNAHHKRKDERDSLSHCFHFFQSPFVCPVCS